MADEFWLNDGQWARPAPLLPNKPRCEEHNVGAWTGQSGDGGRSLRAAFSSGRWRTMVSQMIGKSTPK